MSKNMWGTQISFLFRYNFFYMHEPLITCFTTWIDPLLVNKFVYLIVYVYKFSHKLFKNIQYILNSQITSSTCVICPLPAQLFRGETNYDLAKFTSGSCQQQKSQVEDCHNINLFQYQHVFHTRKQPICTIYLAPKRVLCTKLINLNFWSTKQTSNLGETENTWGEVVNIK